MYAQQVTPTLTEQRELRGWTAQQVADALQVSVSMVFRWERGERLVPSWVARWWAGLDPLAPVTPLPAGSLGLEIAQGRYGWSQATLAARLGVSLGTLRRWLRQEHVPDAAVLGWLARGAPESGVTRSIPPPHLGPRLVRSGRT